MLYLMNDDDEIINTLTKLPSQEYLDAMAQMFGCNLRVLHGEYIGMSAEFKVEDEDATC